tara:strand:- start:30 stop:251 length:222 start_codon:yes stop_codon:yes gene_type:complete
MLVGAILSGLYAGFCAIIIGVNFGLPLWGIILLYPIAGSLGCLAFIARSMLRSGSFAGYPGGHSGVQLSTQNR